MTTCIYSNVECPELTTPIRDPTAEDSSGPLSKHINSIQQHCTEAPGDGIVNWVCWKCGEYPLPCHAPLSLVATGSEVSEAVECPINPIPYPSQGHSTVVRVEHASQVETKICRECGHNAVLATSQGRASYLEISQ